MAQLTIDRTGAAALVTLNRPEKRNALSIELRLALADALAELAADDTVAAIGLTGAGSSFCAGLDVTQFGGDAAHRELLVESSVRCFRAIAECARPTVALINGPAIAGGFARSRCCATSASPRPARVSGSQSWAGSSRRATPPPHGHYRPQSPATSA
jgi:enoyl-CoA hydratase/carnithine racemase